MAIDRIVLEDELNLNPWTHDYHSPLSVVALAEKLLRACRAERDVFFEEMNRPGARVAKGLCISTAREILRQCPAQLDAERVRHIVTLLEQPTADGRHLEHKVVRARAVAQAIDCECDRLFFDEFRRWRREHSGDPELDCFEVLPNQLILSRHPDLSAEFDNEPHFPAARFDDSVDSLKNLRLAPEVLPLRLFQHFGYANQLAFLSPSGGKRFAVGSLGAVDFGRFGDFYELGQDAAEDLELDAGVGFFRDIRPLPTHCSADLLKALLHEAANREADVLVLPELCLSQEALVVCEQALAAVRGKFPRMLIAGSLHCRVGRSRKNRLHVFFRGADGEIKQRLTHDKLGTFYWVDRGKFGPVEFVEDVHRERALTVYMTREGTSMVCLVCADFLQRSVQRALSLLGVRHIFVSSLTKSTGEFEAIAQQLAVADNAITLLAATTSPGESTAALALPLRRHPLTAARNLNGQGLQLFRLRARPGTCAGLVTFDLPAAIDPDRKQPARKRQGPDRGKIVPDFRRARCQASA